MVGMLTVTALYKAYAKKTIVPGTVIILDGTSSSGKSTIAKILQEELKCEYLFIDNFIANQKAAWLEKQIFLKENKSVSLPRDNPDVFSRYYDSMLNKELYIISREDSRAFVTGALDVMAQKINEFVSLGKTVICDLVLVPGYVEEHDILKNAQDAKKFNVLVYCPCKELAQRVENRNKKAFGGRSGEKRTLITALQHLAMKYKPKAHNREEVIDTLSRDDLNYVTNICREYFKTGRSKQFNKNKFTMFVKILESQLGLSNKDIGSVELTPRITCDFVLNSEKYTAQECAQIIKAKVIS